MALALILGGAIGNVIDRVRLGHVIDFIQVYYSDWYFPAFNAADSAITLVWDYFWSMRYSARDAHRPHYEFQQLAAVPMEDPFTPWEVSVRLPHFVSKLLVTSVAVNVTLVAILPVGPPQQTRCSALPPSWHCYSSDRRLSLRSRQVQQRQSCRCVLGVEPLFRLHGCSS